MTLDARELAYDHDEEELGFAEPARAEPEPVPWRVKLGAALVALGALAFGLACLGLGLGGGWTALLLAFVPMVAGALVWFAGRYAGTPAGVRNDGNVFRSVQAQGALAWMLGIAFTGFYVVLYFYEDLLARGMPRVLERPIRLLDPLAEVMTGGAASKWFLYGFLYTLAILVFGVRMLWRWRHSRHHTVRTLSVMGFQLVLAFVLPNVLVLFQRPEFYFSYFWPLKREYLFPESLGALWASGGFGQFAVFWAVVIALVGVPVLTYLVGKRWYCSWVCGCGGLAETLGDPWRQLSQKSRGAWRLERWLVHGVLVLVVVVTALLWINSAREGAVLGGWSGAFAKAYGFWIGAIFSGVVGVGFYPLLGSRVWCRYGCPQAAILGLVQRLKSRFRITTNGGQCMSCGNCSTYCEMGIDVRMYAQQGANVVRAACVGCGMCASVCPRGVLRLENGKAERRFEGDGDPWRTLFDSVRRMDAEHYRAWPGEVGQVERAARSDRPSPGG